MGHMDLAWLRRGSLEYDRHQLESMPKSRRRSVQCCQRTSDRTVRLPDVGSSGGDAEVMIIDEDKVVVFWVGCVS